MPDKQNPNPTGAIDPNAPPASTLALGDEAAREKAKDQAYGGRVKVVVVAQPFMYQGKAHAAGSKVEMNKQEAADAVRHGKARFADADTAAERAARA